MTTEAAILTAVISAIGIIGVSIIGARKFNKKDAESLQNQIDDVHSKVVNFKHEQLPECGRMQNEAKAQAADNSAKHWEFVKLMEKYMAENAVDRAINTSDHKEFRMHLEATICDNIKTKDRMQHIESKIAGIRETNSQLSQQTKNLSENLDKQNQLMESILNRILNGGSHGNL